MSIRKKRLGDLLVEEKKINLPQLQKALKRQRVEGKKLGEILVEEGLVTHEDIINVLEKQLGIERVQLDMIVVDKRAVRLIPQAMCKKHDLFPYEIEENIIKIAVADPLNIFAIDDVGISTGLQVKAYIATKEEITQATERYYSGENVINAAEELSKEKMHTAKEEEEEEEIDDIKNAPAVKMVEYLFKNAIEQGASDIHIEPYENYIRIRYRVDGQLQTVSTLNRDALGALVTRIKILANLNIAEKRIPQDGRVMTNIGDKAVDMRVSILPLITGEKVVIRVLDKDNYKVDKKDLGFTEEELQKIDNIIKSPYGIILVTGPTGSGKSTTLYTILSELNKEDKNIITVEDPVEYSLEGINQVTVNNKAGLTFASGLRSILRQDPDIVMIGEIRDNETAQIAVRASITGHLVLSTLHTNDAPASMVRLVDMGIEAYLVSTAVSGIVAQRLVRKICPNCKVAHEATAYEKRVMGVAEDKPLTVYKGEGCVYCNKSGYKGRRGVYEIMEVDRELRELILHTQNSDKIKDLAVKKGMKTLSMRCRELVLEGITTVEEMINITFLGE
ncbi:type IV pilus assembly protein PilB [Clostridium cavendishii DSM 21758]|uniref:Type IV pilus assembly protein PilB n=1 Tax=Clostridium cavendishii DSM 21758 TaxID=1121302 RepID=A0A1M6LK04_9CLOT|nr:GspE/PulE family protein [Clostridium cavendishii]SHJ71485.1 type IV pilus assembly protein PilB [Clostridium cavendishii DSM 21758]